MKEIVGTMTEREDSELVAACLQGDHAAWEALIVRYQRLIYSIPLKARLSPDDAADILQGGFRPGVEIFSDFQPPHR